MVTDAVELLINRGGPAISVTLPTAGSIQSALYQPIRLQGNADDPEGVSSVQVCVKTTPVCTAPDWKSAVVGNLYQTGWYYDFVPPADGTYNLFVRAYDQYGVQGPIVGPIVFYADSTIPSGGTFEVDGVKYVSTTVQRCLTGGVHHHGAPDGYHGRGLRLGRGQRAGVGETPHVERHRIPARRIDFVESGRGVQQL